MRKIRMRNMVTADGFFAGPKGEIEWHHVDSEFNEDSVTFLDSIDTLLFGRVTYDLMASYWPTAHAIETDTVIAEKMNSLPKVVFSKTADALAWNNTSVLHDITPQEILGMKQAPGKDIAIFGSGTIVSALTELRLIDEYIFVVNPVILGKGKSLFTTITGAQNLQLTNTKRFTSGNIALTYTPA